MDRNENKIFSRRRWTEQEVIALLEKWKTSGLSRKKFAEQNGVKPNTFSRWVQQRLSQQEKPHENEAFLKIELPASSVPFSVMELHSGNKKLVFFSEPSASLLKELLP